MEDGHMSNCNSLGTHQVVKAGCSIVPISSSVPGSQHGPDTSGTAFVCDGHFLFKFHDKTKKGQLIYSVLSAAHFHACILRNVMGISSLFIFFKFFSCHIILSNKRVICKLTITPTHKMAAPIWSKMAAPMWSKDGHHKVASRGGQLGGTRSAKESNWGQSSLRGEQLGVTRPTGEGH
uniref:Uncharacterized protein n=1 Tax=Pipistrellus kuhlii TaxID=59472 RepID=A0A7J7Y9M0_PIPKU|nr:hypothetical protein mPipKuh1_010350 [Pipistrellus kuhlii]